MARPSNTSVTIDGDKFNALSVTLSLATEHDHLGMPMMGSASTSIEVIVDLHDNANMPFELLQKLFELAKVATKEKIKEVKIEYWQDEDQKDVLCGYVFNGWISHWVTSSGNGSNHSLAISIQPALDSKNFIDLRISN